MTTATRNQIVYSYRIVGPDELQYERIRRNRRLRSVFWWALGIGACLYIWAWIAMGVVALCQRVMR